MGSTKLFERVMSIRDIYNANPDKKNLAKHLIKLAPIIQKIPSEKFKKDKTRNETRKIYNSLVLIVEEHLDPGEYSVYV